MLAFEGSPIRKLAPELDAAKVEEHEKLLNDSQYKHLCAIRTCMKDLGHKLFEMTPEMFIEDIFECCRFMLDSPDWEITASIKMFLARYGRRILDTDFQN